MDSACLIRTFIILLACRRSPRLFRPRYDRRIGSLCIVSTAAPESKQRRQCHRATGVRLRQGKQDGMSSKTRIVFIVVLAVAAPVPSAADAAEARNQQVPLQLAIEQMDAVTAGNAGVDAAAVAFAFGSPGRTSAGTNAFVSAGRYIDIARGSANALACCTSSIAAIAGVEAYGTGDTVYFNRVNSGNYFQANTHAVATTRGAGSAIAFSWPHSERFSTVGDHVGFAGRSRP